MRLRKPKFDCRPAMAAIAFGGLLAANAAAQEEGSPGGAISGGAGIAVLETVDDAGGTGATTLVIGERGNAATGGGVTGATGATTLVGPAGASGDGESGAGATGAGATGGGSLGLSTGGFVGGQPGIGIMFGGGMPAQADNLAGLLAAAMSRNPDIVVAEAKVRAAQSELDRTRLEASRQVVDTFQAVRFNRKSIEIAKAQVANSKEQQARVKELVKQGTVSTTEVTAIDVAAREAELSLIKAEAMLEATMATLDYLTGGQSMPSGSMMPGMPGIGSGFGGPGAIFGSGAGGQGSADTGGGRSATGAPGAGVEGGSEGAAGPASGTPPSGTTPAVGESAAPSGVGTGAVGGTGGGNVRFWSVKDSGSTFHERLRKKLDEPTALDFADASLGDVMRYIDDVHGITNILIDRATPDGRNLNDEPITLKLEKVPLAAALKAIEDVANVKFLVTDYGLRLTPRDTHLGESVSLREFVKSKPVARSYYPGGYGGGLGYTPGAGYDEGGTGDPAAGAANPFAPQGTSGGAAGAGDDAGPATGSPDKPKP